MPLTSWLKLVEQLAPIALIGTPLAPLVPAVILGIQTAEQIKGASGQQKLILAQQIVNASVMGANAQAGHQVIDPAAVSDLTAKGISTVVTAVNLAHNPTGVLVELPTK